MKLYAIRDRLLDYYMQPFAGPDHKPVLASIATMINSQGEKSDIAQAPHHFEVWELGEVDQEGHINPTRKLICDCASLVRPGLRDRTEKLRGDRQDDPTAEISRGKTPDTYGPNGANQRPPTGATQAADHPAPQAGAASGGVPGGTKHHLGQPEYYTKNGQVMTDL